jgi:predicted N-acetyltransferase YhbS
MFDRRRTWRRGLAALGHMQYYACFAFLSSTHLGIDCECDAPEDVFMVKEWQTGYLHRWATSTIKYHTVFSNA